MSSCFQLGIFFLFLVNSSSRLFLQLGEFSSAIQFKELIMRIVKELSAQNIRITIFDWNEKYLIKYEIGPLEQTYKISKWDVVSEDELITEITSTDILIDIQLRFDEMGKTLMKLSK